MDIYEKADHQTKQVGLTLVQAAAHLGITPNALRMRYRRGKVRGFKRGGRLFIELDDRTDRAEQTEQPSERVNGGDVARAFNFVLADNTRLNDRLDRLMQMLEREQVLRQQMQGQIERLTDRLALPSPEAGGSDVVSRLEDTEHRFDLLKRAVVQLMAFLEKSKP